MVRISLSSIHNSKFEMSKLTLVGFSHRRMHDPACPGKMIAETRPSLSICGMDIKPVKSHKFLGVVFDQELHWNVQAKRTIAKATKWTLASHRLARLAVGISLRQMRQLYQAITVPSFTYAADVWFTPVCRGVDSGMSSGSIGVARKLSTIQRMATMAITGALRTSTSDVMEAHANLLPIELTMDRVCHRAALCLAALLESHPLSKPVHQSAR